MSMNLLALIAALAAGAGVGMGAWGLFGRKGELSRYAAVLDAYDTPKHQEVQPDWRERLELFLARAGWTITLQELAIVWVILVVVIALVFTILARRPLAGLLLGPIGATGGIYWAIALSRIRRVRLIDEQLVRVLFSLSGLLQAGRRPDSALEEAARTVGAPLGPELSWVVRQYKVGVELPAALRTVATRLGSREFEYFTIAIEVNQEKGGNIVNMLGKLAGSVATHIAMRGQQSALLAEVQMTRHIASLAPLGAAFLLWIASPATLQLLFKTRSGLFMLLGACVLWTIGFIVMARMVKPLREMV
jgi:tight adherence protein B